jgi:hypothetical protein
MGAVEAGGIRAFLEEVGRRYLKPARLLLLGGSALCLLGNPRPTLDIDYVGNDLRKGELERIIDNVASEMGVEADAVPIGQFIPIPAGADERHLLVGRFELLDVYICDPYSIALGKIDRGFDTDIDDVVFLLRHGLITLEHLERIVKDALQRAQEFDMDPAMTMAHLDVARKRMAVR